MVDNQDSHLFSLSQLIALELFLLAKLVTTFNF